MFVKGQKRALEIIGNHNRQSKPLETVKTEIRQIRALETIKARSDKSGSLK